MSFSDGFTKNSIGVPPVAPTSGNVLVYDGTTWVAGTVSGGGGTGDITSVTAGTNLTGGGTSGDITVSLDQDINLTTITASSAFIQGDIIVNGTASVAQLNTLIQTSLLVGDKYITILSGGVNHTGIDGAGMLWGTSSGPGETTGALGEHAHVLYDAVKDSLKIFPNLTVSGSIESGGPITGSYFVGNGSNLTNLTASSMPLFQQDVRKQISGSQYAAYNTSSGVISLPFTGSTIGTTPVILGTTIPSLTGLASISSSQAQLSTLTSSVISASTISAGNYSFANASSSIDPAVLDDYREGSWVPRVLSNGAGTFVTSSSGKYTKIGNTILANGNVRVLSKSGGNISDIITIGGLPFTSSANITCSVYFGFYQNFQSNFPSQGALFPNSTIINIYSAVNAASDTPIAYSNLNPGGNVTVMNFQLIYYVT
jgi:hypothetical protein